MPSHPQLDADDVHVWSCDLSWAAAALPAAASDLSEEERERAARYLLSRHGQRFAAGRGALRILLARYLRCEPRDLVLRSGSEGKPALAGKNELDLRFNLSHSADAALFAFARGRELGVDVERLRPGVDCEGIARRFFSPREAEQLLDLPPERRTAAFFTCWTRKEAYVKARGSGLAVPLDSFEVDPAGPPALRSRGGGAEAERFTLLDLPAPAGFVAALAVEGGSFRLRSFTLT